MKNNEEMISVALVVLREIESGLCYFYPVKYLIGEEVNNRFKSGMLEFLKLDHGGDDYSYSYVKSFQIEKSKIKFLSDKFKKDESDCVYFLINNNSYESKYIQKVKFDELSTTIKNVSENVSVLLKKRK